MLAGVLVSTLIAGLPTQAPPSPLRLNQAGYPWIGFTFGMAAGFPPIVNIRANFGVLTAWDIVEFGGELMFGGWFHAHVGGTGYLKLTPYPVGLGRIFYARGSVGRLHLVTPISRFHVGNVQAVLGFRLPIAGWLDGEPIMAIEAGVDYSRECRDWAMPCTQSRGLWWPAVMYSVSFR